MKKYRLKKWNELNVTQKVARVIIGGVGWFIGSALVTLIMFMIYALIYVSMPINAF